MPRRRYWGDADNLQIVEGSFVGRREVAVTTRRHGIALPADYVAAAVSEGRALRRDATYVCPAEGPPTGDQRGRKKGGVAA